MQKVSEEEWNSRGWYKDAKGCTCKCQCKEPPCHDPYEAVGGLKEHAPSDCSCATPQDTCPQYDNGKSQSADFGSEYPSDAGPMYGSKPKSGATTVAAPLAVLFVGITTMLLLIQ